jgi:hypothetical protein
MGLRDYGLQPALAAFAFDQFKRAERKWREAGSGDVQARVRRAVADLDGPAHAPAHRAACDNWMTRVLAIECTVIGLSLSPTGWGLHSLLVQRARNYARRGILPRVRQLVAVGGCALPDLELVTYRSWEDAWASLAMPPKRGSRRSH